MGVSQEVASRGDKRVMLRIVRAVVLHECDTSMSRPFKTGGHAACTVRAWTIPMRRCGA
jgi:hypothetical protein